MYGKTRKEWEGDEAVARCDDNKGALKVASGVGVGGVGPEDVSEEQGRFEWLRYRDQNLRKEVYIHDRQQYIQSQVQPAGVLAVPCYLLYICCTIQRDTLSRLLPFSSSHLNSPASMQAAIRIQRWFRARCFGAHAPPPLHRTQELTSTLTSDYAALLDDRTSADVTFVNSDRITKNILAARSAYFRAMFFSGMREAQRGNDITIRDTSPAAFRALLRYLCTDQLAFDDTLLVDVSARQRS